jgi:acyl-ACP thioesterase
MYSFESRVRYSECDEDAKLSLEGLIDYLQDCSTFQSEQLGVGFSFMREHHFAWFIAAWQIWIDRIPRFLEPIKISTWCPAARATDAHRNFTITSPSGASYVRADSIWFVFDTQLKRPVRIPASEAVYQQGDPPLDLPPTHRKLPVEGNFKLAQEVKVAKQQLDTNGHVNNVQYVRMAVDALDVRIEDVQRICVQYKRMALLGDRIVPRVHTAARAMTVDLANPLGASFAIVYFEKRPKPQHPDEAKRLTSLS